MAEGERNLDAESQKLMILNDLRYLQRIKKEDYHK